MNEIGQARRTAKELTEEIEQATNMAAGEFVDEKAQNSGDNLASGGIERGRAGVLGGKVLNNNLENGEARVLEMVAHENGERAELSGEESELLVRERLAEDREDIDNELGRNGRYVQNIMSRNSEEITTNVMTATDALTRQTSFRPNQLDLEVAQERTKYLKNVFNRILGSRN